MSCHNVRNWPPVWIQGTEKDRKIVKGEVGILKHVRSYGPPANKCYLVIEHARQHYVGTLIFDDVTFCQQMTNLLRQQVGRPIKDISDLDLNYTL